ncbi:MAG: hypothetical protein KGN80_00825 [Acidobacteriota bacterium]|nr:hypothetical protein [Acidobacteriota bacterium]
MSPRMFPKTASLLACVMLAGGALHAEESEVPVAINLPTADRMQFWDIGLIFTHRFLSPVKDHGKDLYGLDGFTYAGFGFAFGIKTVPGLNLEIYRTADNKTFTLALQQQLLNKDRIRVSARVERFDEVVTRVVTSDGTVGISGTAFQLPTELFITDDFVLSVVPTYLSRTTTQEKSIFNYGVGLHYDFTGKFRFVAEYYPRPSKIAKTFQTGFAAGFSYKTFKHRFTLVGTNSTGTTAHQVLGGDYGGGPKPHGDWSIGFNVARVF